MEHQTEPAIATILEFFDCINRHDVDGLAHMLTEDHEFIDSLGNSVVGREAMRLGWRSYFALCPDYWVEREEIFVRGNLVAVVGHAGGTIAAAGELPAANRWRTPACWLAALDAGKVKRWRVYADNKPVYDILARTSRS
jgi:ketosteroid isomerase-like protein